MKRISSWLMMTLLVAPTLQAKQYIFPAKGQTPEQQAIDEAACKQWATEQTSAQPAAPVAETAEAEKARGGAVRGAAVGAAVAKVTDNDTSEAAAAGAIVGVAGQRSANRRAEKQATQQAEQATQAAADAKVAEFEKATAACLTGKGYTVQ